MKKVFIFNIFVLLIFFEVISFIYFRFLSNDKNNLALYEEKEMEL